MSRLHGHGRNLLRAVLAVGILSAAVLSGGGTARAALQYAPDCSDCHTMPPLDSVDGSRNPDSGAFAGNHETHAGSSKLSCVKCHGPLVVNYSTAHRTKQIKVTGNVNNSPHPDRALYARAGNAFLNQTTVPPVGSCSNVNCHFEKATPVWGGSRFSAANDCNACHTTQTLSTAHSTHLARYGTTSATCAKCHPDHGSATTPFAHATSAGHLGRTIAVTAGSYTGGNSSFLPSQSASRTLGNCSTSYCHSPGQGPTGGALQAGDYARPNWGDRNAGACGSCHAISNATSGSHARHLAADTNCGSCHAGATVAAYPGSTHGDGVIDVSVGGYDRGGAPGNGYGSCTVYCHSTGLNPAAPSYRPSLWGGQSLSCNGCHGDKTLTPISSGSHAKHLASAECADCHNLTVTSGSLAISDRTRHLDQLVQLAFAAGRVVGTASYGGVNAPLAKVSTGSFSSCSNIACHSNGTGIYTGTVIAGTTPVWGGSGGCGSCHGNTTYTDYRKAAPLYVSGSPKPNAHARHIQTGTLTSHDIECKYCHASVVNTSNDAASGPHAGGSYSVAGGGASYPFEDGDNITAAHSVKVATTLSYSYRDAAYGNGTLSTCSNVSCHPSGLAGTKAASKTSWDNSHQCSDCHNVNLKNNTGYHHAMRNYSAGGAAYPTGIPGLTAGANDNSRRCTMCHVDHDIFSPDLNTGNTKGAAANLRSAIGSAVTKSAGYTNSDFDTTSGGICISCHSNELFKDTGNVRVKNEANSTKTPAITLKNFSSSSHEYAIASALRRDGTSFNANCSKCHNGRVGEAALFSSMTTAVHDSPSPRLYATLGLQDGDVNFCYRCHSTTANAIGGTKKPVNGYDYYRSAVMSAAAQDTYSTMKKGTGSGSSTQSSATLYMRNNITPAWWAVPSKPTAYILASGTYAGTTTFTQRPLDTTSGATQETRAQTTGSTATRYLRYLQFVTPTVASTYSIASGSTIQVKYRVGASAAAAVQTRIQIYKRTSAGVNTALNTAVQVDTASWPTTAANRTYNFVTNTAATLAAGDCLIVELEAVQTNTTSATATLYWGLYGTDTGSIVLPAAASFTTSAATVASGRHDVNNPAYAGLHRPSAADETFAYLSANKHVTCEDCHNPHQAKAGNPVLGSGTLANSLRGATGVTTPTWPAKWIAPAQSAYGTVPAAASAEWQICFKCHSGANSNVATWGGTGAAAWTDLGLEFNPNNGSRHPIATPLATTNRLTAARLSGGWAPGMVMNCSDCHATDSTASKGPHGSSVKWMLAGTNKAWPYTTTAGNGASTGTLFRLATYNTGAGTKNGLFCLNCHTIRPTTGGNSWHTHGDTTGGEHGSSTVMACSSCHIRVPHGGKISRLLQTLNTPARYKSDGNGAASSFDSWGPNTTGGIKGSAVSSSNFNSTCSEHNSGAGEAW